MPVISANSSLRSLYRQLWPAAYRPVMAVEVAGTFLYWSQSPLLPASFLSHKTLNLVFSINAPGQSIASQKSCSLGTAINHGSRQRRRARERRSTARVSSSASLDGFGFVDDGEDNEDEFVKRIKDFAPKFKIESEPQMNLQGAEISNISGESAPSSSPVSNPVCPSLLSTTSEIRSMRTEPGTAGDGFSPNQVDIRANCFDLPLSLRILKQKKKKQWESAEMADSAYSSVKKAFSSMVFIVRELQSHTIRMREALFSSSNLQIQGMLARVHDEIHASFVWLFQRIFSATPTLMIYLMLLLVNFTVFSVTDYPANAKPPIQSVSATVEESRNPSARLDPSAVKSFSVGRSAAVGGSGDGGGGKKAQAVSGAADDGRLDRFSSSFHKGGRISPEAVSTSSAKKQDHEKAWRGILEEAERIRANERHEVLMDPDTLQSFVSPVTVELEPDDLSVYASTEFLYRRALADGTDDPLILSNFAQFLYVVIGDHDRAEEYFKRAAMAEPADPEALSRYANFLWVARKDLAAAEETFLEAIEADPGNSYYSANYAHFLWNTGGEDTCYPLDACDS